MTEELTRRWSVSAFGDFTECGEMFRLKRVEKKPAQPSMSMAGGLAFHSWTDCYDRRLMQEGHADIADTPTYAELMEDHVVRLEEETGFDRKNFQLMGKWTYDTYINSAVEWCGLYVKWRAEDKWKIPTDLPPDKDGNTTGIEYRLDYQCGDVTMVGYIDRIWFHPEFDNDTYVATDTKTWGVQRPSSQLISYKLGAQACGINVREVGYYEARKGETPKLKDYRGWGMDRLRIMYEQAAWAEYDGYYIPQPGKNCFTCSVKNHCKWEI